MADVNIEIQDLKQLIARIAEENAAGFKELRERFKETDARLDARFKETDKKIKEASDLFTTQWGKLMESLIEGDLLNLLQARGIKVRDTSTRRKGNYQGNYYEFDIIAHNGDEIVVVEVKTTLRVKHVRKFVKRLEQVKTWLPEYKSFKVYGAIAYLKAEEESDIFAQSKQLFTIRATGNSASIINDKDFVPRAF
ncbi:MAG: hypothetical protein AAGJ18_09260 [Bacteroidota bacterium]